MKVVVYYTGKVRGLKNLVDNGSLLKYQAKNKPRFKHVNRHKHMEKGIAQ